MEFKKSPPLERSHSSKMKLQMSNREEEKCPETDLKLDPAIRLERPRESSS